MVKAVTEYLKGAVEVPHHRTLVVVGAQGPVDARGGVPDGIEAQCRAAWERVTDALAEKNMDLRHVVAVETDLADRAHLAAANDEQKRHLRHHLAQTVRIVGLPDERWLIQVSVVAAKTR